MTLHQRVKGLRAQERFDEALAEERAVFVPAVRARLPIPLKVDNYKIKITDLKVHKNGDVEALYECREGSDLLFKTSHFWCGGVPVFKEDPEGDIEETVTRAGAGGKQVAEIRRYREAPLERMKEEFLAAFPQELAAFLHWREEQAQLGRRKTVV